MRKDGVEPRAPDEVRAVQVAEYERIGLDLAPSQTPNAEGMPRNWVEPQPRYRERSGVRSSAGVVRSSEVRSPGVRFDVVGLGVRSDAGVRGRPRSGSHGVRFGAGVRGCPGQGAMG